jgi:hypothetical protein
MFMFPQVDNDFCFWRSTYEGGDTYIREHVFPLSDEESTYRQRLCITPEPADARSIIEKVLNALLDRMRFATRYGQLVKKMQDGPGLSGNYGSINSYIVGELAKELLIEGRVGVFFSNSVNIESPIDLQNSPPICKTVRAEDISKVKPAPYGSPSQFSLVEFQLRDCETTTNVKLWTDEMGKVFAQTTPDGEPVDMNTNVIPFVLVQHPSLMARLAKTQKALTNLLSVMATNSPDLLATFLTRQRDIHNLGASMRRETSDATAGRTKGLWYEKNLDAPSFISQPPGPMAEARAIVEALRDSMTFAAGLSGDSDAERSQNLANVVGSLGETLLSAERQIWANLGRYANVSESPVVRYPETWKAQTAQERLADSAKTFEVAQSHYGRAGMEISAVAAVEFALAGRPSTEIESAVAAVKKSRCLANDLTAVVRGYEGGGLDTATIADRFGCLPEVAVAAKEESAERAEQLAKAAENARATKAADSVGTTRDSQLAEKTLSQKDGEGSTRGEGK